MAVICSSCKTEKDVRRDFVTMWNGNVYDLCWPCARPLAAALDAIQYGQPGEPYPPAGKS
jgi:hypothetical protein